MTRADDTLSKAEALAHDRPQARVVKLRAGLELKRFMLAGDVRFAERLDPLDASLAERTPGTA